MMELAYESRLTEIKLKQLAEGIISLPPGRSQGGLFFLLR